MSYLRALIKNKLGILIVMLSGIGSGVILQWYLTWNHDSYNTSQNRIILSAIMLVIVFLITWFFTSSVLVGRDVEEQDLKKVLRKDSYTYLILFSMYAFKLDFTLNYAAPSFAGLLWLVAKIFVFKNYKEVILNRIERFIFWSVSLPKLIKDYFIKIDTKLVSLTSPYSIFSNKSFKILNIILLVYILLICFTRIKDIYEVPMDKPYYTSGYHYDEPLAINPGINILERKGDQLFYNFGGTNTIPYALTFFVYSKIVGVKPYYKFLNTMFFHKHWPDTGRIYPVKPIYICRILIISLFIVGIFLFVSLFSWHLLPIPFLLFPMIDYSKNLEKYRIYLTGLTHATFLSGLTSLFFICTLITDNINKYINFLLLCYLFASLAVSSKIYAAYVVLLPISLTFYMCYKYDIKDLIKKKVFFKIVGIFVIPYCLINPGIILHPTQYFSWLARMLLMGHKGPAFMWMPGVGEILSFIKDLYFIEHIPNLFLIILIISTAILMMRISKIAFAAFVFFHLYSFQAMANVSSYGIASRRFTFLLLTHIFFIFFPLIYYYKKSHNYIKIVVLSLAIITTGYYYPITKIGSGIMQAVSGEFTTTWEKESRDELEKYVLDNDLTLYFFDFHHFSLPNTIYNRIQYFTEIDELPKQLKTNERIGFIKYKKSPETHNSYNVTIREDEKKYQEMVAFLKNKYKLDKYMGPQEVLYLMEENDAKDPAIVLMRQERK